MSFIVTANRSSMLSLGNGNLQRTYLEMPLLGEPAGIPAGWNTTVVVQVRTCELGSAQEGG
jgi:hypothetical protein